MAQRKSEIFDGKRYNATRDAVCDLVDEAHGNAIEHGFYNEIGALCESRGDNPAFQAADRRNFILAQLAKITEEVGEAVKAICKGNNAEYLDELSDIVIRTLDLAGYSTYSDKFAKTMLDKMERNIGREYMHGRLS